MNFDVATPKFRNVQLVDRLASESNVLGTLHVTTSHIIFKAEEDVKEIWVANGLIGTVERGTATNAGYQLCIKCKHFQVITLLVPKEKDCQELHETLISCSRLLNINDCFAFSRRLNNLQKNDNIENRNRLNWEAEFVRQGMSGNWKISHFNENYAHCDTYPEYLWMPAKASTEMLIGSCKFRSRARLPTLTYYSKHNGAILCRCSQPLTGFSSARCVEDESLMNLIWETSGSKGPLYLVDTRPRVNAMVNKVQGKGFEDVRNYTNMQFHFFDIENIHVMRGSQSKLLEACAKHSSISEYFKAVEHSGWLKHLRCLLECGKFIAEAVKDGISCVVHCSDGWDRTSQTLSIAQLILDPYYRTIKGFETLIEKDWLGFGFKFDDRCGHVTPINDDLSKEVSPIFTQFLEVVYQLTRQKPLDFEFNERFLIEINEHAYSCIYGTFIGNCDKDRKDLRLSARTESLWKHLDKYIDDYKNPFYTSKKDFLEDVNVKANAFTVWTGLYNRFDTGIQPRELVQDITAKNLEQIEVLENAIKMLEKGEKMKYPVNPVWQPLYKAEQCSAKICRREYSSVFEKRDHCYSCGKIY
uniref:Phosphatidylinositol-3-phosphatase n=1 Tax=Panagrolaimus sp. ES5 TaxID=591445 RepID=A0AC34FWT3_9BILA